jgi:hypothetical protein
MPNGNHAPEHLASIELAMVTLAERESAAFAQLSTMALPL